MHLRRYSFFFLFHIPIALLLSVGLSHISQAIDIEVPYTCGDGIRNFPYEDCDDGNFTDGDGCSSACRFESNRQASPESYCGNSILEGEYEECDDGNFVDGDGCSNKCLLETATLFSS